MRDAERTQHSNRIKGLCATQGIYDYEPVRGDRMRRLEALRTPDGHALPVRLKAEIARELQRLELVQKMVAALEVERDASITDKASTHLNANKIRNLAKLKAIEPEFATVLVGEVFYRRFNNRRAGWLCWLDTQPIPERSNTPRSGDQQGREPQGPHHDDRARLDVVALSPASALSVWFCQRVGSLKGRIRRIAIVAMARELVVALWRYLETGLVPEGAALKS